ncbi:hypothetical protein V6N11_082267 [Hibiscus sabdariffa]|uniref:Helicase ATP-binding domain-containing protein n=1 Tax=Hibiscus sabdariffa TaxID=183260 RepID=A0ABR2QHH5_9ROSI
MPNFSVDSSTNNGIPMLLLQLDSSSPSLWSFFTLNRPFLYKQKRNVQPQYPSLTTMAAHTQGRLPISSLNTHNLVPKREMMELETDANSILNERIRRDHSKREATRPVMDSQEADMYMQLVKEHQQRGLQKLKGDRESSTEPIEYVFIEYADGMAKLPVNQAARMLYRYNLSNETKKPRTLSKLSDTIAWERRNTKGKVTIQKMVVDLMELYLHRLKQKRPHYPRSPAMAEFAAQFPYEPTPDQKQAFIDVEKDLTERETPMDRLICGDVGFGKTEVALRAIFCVVSAGKQAMVLTPTVVLAKQHFDVISERFSKDPTIEVGHLSPFQRFGVKQKEKIASFKTSVDVLTLSATPIPRTLYLALTGFRDASLISTAPPERGPIKTCLSAFGKEKVIAAIQYELDRGGQVFYLAALDNDYTIVPTTELSMELMLQFEAELLLELPREQLLDWIFQCLAELHSSLPALIKY